MTDWSQKTTQLLAKLHSNGRIHTQCLSLYEANTSSANLFGLNLDPAGEPLCFFPSIPIENCRPLGLFSNFKKETVRLYSLGSGMWAFTHEKAFQFQLSSEKIQQ